MEDSVASPDNSKKRSLEDATSPSQVSKSLFVVNPLCNMQNQKRSAKYYNIFQAIQTFYSIYRHYQIPSNYIALKKNGFLEKHEGMHLGRYFNKAKIDRQPKELVEYLEAAGIIDSNEDIPELNRLLAAVKAFIIKYQHLFVMKDYVIPSTAEYDKDLWDYPLGKELFPGIVKYSPRYRHKLSALGFSNVWNDFNYLHRCIKIYQEINGHVKIPYDFVIPVDSAEYPVVMWTLPLGQKLMGIRFHGTHPNIHHIGLLSQLGVDMRFAQMADNALGNILTAVQLYRAKYNTLNIPPDYVIPRNDHTFPKTYWNMQLGQLWSQIVEFVE